MRHILFGAAALLCLSLAGCRGCSDAKTDAPVADAGAGVTPIGTAKGPGQPSASEGLEKVPVKALTFRVPAWASPPKKPRAIRPSEARARVNLAQAMAGYRYALTGDGQIQLKPLATGTLPPHKLHTGANLGLVESIATATVRDPGGHPVLVTGRISIGKTPMNPVLANHAVRDALLRAARQSRGSGQMLLTSAGNLRREGAELQIDVTIRVFQDGQQ